MFFSIQNFLIFPGGREMGRTPASPPFGWAYEDLMFSVGGEKTNAWFIPAPGERGTLLFSHGNAGTIADRLESIAVFRGLGFGVLIYDYGGYGRSSGRASEQRCYDDVRAAWRHLTETRGIAPGRIVLFGRSLGGGPTVQLATEVLPRAVVLESTFTSVADLGQEIFRFLPVRRFVRHRFDNAAKIGRIHAPLLVVHSPEDRLIRWSHGKKLFDLANDPKQFLEIRGDHNEGFIVSSPRYEQGLAAFLDPLFGEGRSL